MRTKASKRNFSSLLGMGYINALFAFCTLKTTRKIFTQSRDTFICLRPIKSEILLMGPGESSLGKMELDELLRALQRQVGPVTSSLTNNLCIDRNVKVLLRYEGNSWQFVIGFITVRKFLRAE